MIPSPHLPIYSNSILILIVLHLSLSLRHHRWLRQRKNSRNLGYLAVPSLLIRAIRELRRQSAHRSKPHQIR